MVLPRLLKGIQRYSANISLRWLLVIPFVLQTVGATALVGYFSYRSGQQSVENMACQLLQQTSGRVSDRLTSYLLTPQQAVAANQLALKQGTLNLNDREQVRQQLWQQMLLNPSLSSTVFWSEQGTAVGYGRILSVEEQKFIRQITGKTFPIGEMWFNENRPNRRQFWRVDAQGQPQELIYALEDDFRQLDWYRQARAVGTLRWTPIFVSRVVPALQTLAFAPAYDGTEQLQGLFTANYFIAEFSVFLSELHFSPTGQVFIVERSGDIVATSVLAEAPAMEFTNGKPDRLAAVKSRDDLTRAVAQQLIQKFGGFHQIRDTQQLVFVTGGEREFVQVTPYSDRHGLDWLVVMVIPEADFMAQIHAQNQRTVVLCLITLGVTIAVGFLVARRITKPLKQLNRSAHQIAQNQFEPGVVVSGVGEVWQLSQAFQKMAEELQTSFQIRNDYAQHLEQQVQERTAELAQANKLREAIFNESTDAIFLVGPAPANLILDCNQRAVEMFESARKGDLIGIQGTTLQKQPYTDEEVAVIVAEVKEKGFWSREIEYVTSTGKTFWANMAAKPIQVAELEMQLVRLTDISDRKQAELALQQSEAALREAQRVAHVGSWEFDLKTQSTLWSEEMYWIYQHDPTQPPPSPEELLAHWVHPDDKAVFQSFAACLNQGHTAEQDFRILLPDGSIRYIAGKGEPVFAPTGELVRLRGTALDVTERKLTESKLRQTEQWLQQYSRQSPTTVYTVVQEPDGRIWFENITSAVETMHEVSREQVLEDAQLIFSQIHPDDVAAYIEATNRSVERLEMFSHEWRIITPSGKLKWEQASSQPERRSNGAIAWHGVVQDVTDRKQTELALKAKTEELDRFFSVALDLLCIADTNGYFRRLNQEWERTLGYSLHELEGSRFLDFVHPDDLKSTLNEISVLADQKISLNFVNRYRCRNGSYRWIEWRSFPVGDLIYAAARDITDRKQAEEALRQSEQKFKGAFDTISVGMALVSPVGGFLEVNAALCQMLDYTEDELLRLRLEDIEHPDDLDVDAAWISSLLLGERLSYQVEKQFVSKFGNVIWGLMNLAVMRDAQEAPLYLIMQIADVSDRHKLDTMKDEFISVVSHELRTPLTAIRGSLGILTAGVLQDEPETAQQMLDVALRSADRLVRLVNDILDLERLESGKAALVKEFCEVNNLIEQAVESVQTLAVQSTVSIEWTSVPTSVYVAPDAIVQTLTNLLSNAIKFSPPGSQIRINAAMGDPAMPPISLQFPEANPPYHSCILVAIADQGRGIPPEKLETIFGRFQQVDSSDSRQKGGTGLGLAICKSIVHQHQGHIWVESVVGVGSTFYFTLPINE